MASIVRAKNPTNLSSVNLNAIVEQNSNKYFNNFFEIPVEVSSNVDAAIVGFFERTTGDTESARQLASAVIYTSIKQGLDPMETLAEFQQIDPGQLDAYTALFLNFDRIGTSYLGLANIPKINKYIQRSILP